MLKKIADALRRWYYGKERESGIPTFGDVKTYLWERHWTAKVAAQLAAFYMKHWQWLWGTLIAAAIAIYAAL